MPTTGLRNVVARLGHAAARQAVAGRSCGELLDRFIASRDEPAFAELVRRHGPRVFAVCRRVLGHHQLAEDAYQAVFVVLARKAHAIRPRSAVGGFLYGVARKAALEAYAVSRRRKETLVGRVPEAPAAVASAVEPDVLAMLDEEIANLSEPLRAAVVLCELDGVSRSAAARQLGVAEGTVSSRLAAARKQLAARLAKRGVAFSAGLFAALAEPAAAALPPLLEPAAAPAAAAIAAGVMRTMILSKLKAAVTLGVVLTAFAAWSLVPSGMPTATAAPQPKAEVVKKPAGVIWTYNAVSGKLVGYDPDGTRAKELVLKDGPLFLGLTPDGERILYAGANGKLPPNPKAPPAGLTLHLRPLGEVDAGTDLGVPFNPKTDTHPFHFSRDGSKLVFSRLASADQKYGWPCRHFLVDVATKALTELKAPAKSNLIAIAPDGTWALALEREIKPVVVPPNAKETPLILHRIPLDGGEPAPLAEQRGVTYAAVARDGKTVLFSGLKNEKRKGERSFGGVLTLDAATNAVTELATDPTCSPAEVAWAPDEAAIVYLSIKLKPLAGYPNSFVPEANEAVVADRTGKTLTTWPVQDFAKEKDSYTQLLGWFPAAKKVSATPPKIDPKAAALVAQLGDAEFPKRQAAEKQLREMGTAALAALKAGRQSDDPEVVQRCEKLIGLIVKADAETFAKAFLADKQFSQTFDHPIWTRWAKLAGDDRGSRELFVEVLGVEGAATALGRLADTPTEAEAVYPAEIDRLRVLMQPRAKMDDGNRRMMNLCASLGEATYAVYLGTFAGAASRKPDARIAGDFGDPEGELYVASRLAGHLDRGAWQPKNAYTLLPANLVLIPPLRKVTAAALLNLKNPAVIAATLRSFLGFRHLGDDLSVALPLARMTCQEASFPMEVRAASWPYLAEAGEVAYLPAMAAGQADMAVVQEFGRSDESGRRYTVAAADVSLAAQLILHGKAPTDFGFLAKLNTTGRAVDRSGLAYGFADAATRAAAHDKALAFLKTAPPPKAKPATDRERLQGRWKLVASDDSGRLAKEKGYTKNVLTFAGDTLAIASRRDDADPPRPFRLDEATTPKRIDFQTEGKKNPQDRLGVYKLEGDKLTVCSSTVVPARPDLRPTDFTISKTNGRLLSVYERMRDDDPRWAVEWFAGHALAGRADVAEDVLADADEGARLRKAGRFKEVIEGQTLKAAAVWADATTGRAVAVSGDAKLAETQPYGTKAGRVVFSLTKAKAGWRIADIDFRTADQATAAVDTFRKKNPDATEAKSGGKP